MAAKRLTTMKSSRGLALLVAVLSLGLCLLATSDAQAKRKKKPKPSPPTLTVQMAHPAWVGDAAASADGRFAATVSEKQLMLWSLAQGKLLRTIPAPTKAPLYQVAFSPDGRTVATGDGQGSIALWDIETGKLIRRMGAQQLEARGNVLVFLPRRAHQSSIKSITFSRDGTRLLSASEWEVGLWDTHSGDPRGEVFRPRKLQKEGTSVPLWDAVFTRDEAAVYISGWDPDNQDSRHTFDKSQGARFSGHDAVWLWSPESGQVLKQLEAPSGWKLKLALSPDGTTLAGLSRSNYHPGLSLWDTRTGRTHSRSNAAEYGSDLAFSSDSQFLITQSRVKGQERELVSRNVASGEVLWHRPNRDHVLVVLPDRQQLLSIGRTLRLFDIATGEGRWTAGGETQPTNGISTTGEGLTVVQVTQDQRILTWDLVKGERTDTGSLGWPTAGKAHAVSTDGSRAAVEERSEVVVYDTNSSKAILRVPLQEVMFFGDRWAFSPDGKLLITRAGNGRGVRATMHDVDSGRVLWEGDDNG